MNYLLISSGFLLGWTLGANDGGNIFGPAVGTKMLKFKYAAIVASIFVIIGAVLQGGGATQTLSALGSVNMISGSFTVAIAAALTLFLMLRAGIPVSSSQAVVGAILGWNFFSGTFTDVAVLAKIFSTWVITPILSGSLAILFYLLFRYYFSHKGVSLFKLDWATRTGFIVLIGFSAYSLGANNIGNVVGMFVNASPFEPINLFGIIKLSASMQLFFVGGLAIATGILTRSMSNANTVGKAIFKMSPLTGFIAILSSSLVLFLFSSRTLQLLFIRLHLPTLPLVPVSSSQAIVGAILGIGIIKKADNIQYRTMFRIALGWVINPVIACLICFLSLFFVQNVFDQVVYTPTTHIFDTAVMEKLETDDIEMRGLNYLKESTFDNSKSLRDELNKLPTLSRHDKTLIARRSEYHPVHISWETLETIREQNYFSHDVFVPLLTLGDESFDHKWQIVDKLSEFSPHWQYKPAKRANEFYNSELEKQYDLLFKLLYEAE